MTSAALLLAHLMISPPSFEGLKPGERARGRRHQALLVPAGQVHAWAARPSEPERRPGEDQVEVTLTRGFWMGKYEVTQGQWKRVVGKLPGELTAELPEGDDLPVGNVNFAEAEAFCRKLTELAAQSGDLPDGLGVPAADRGPVGVRLPGRDDDGHRVRRQAQQQAGELQGQAVQRGPSRGRRWAGGQGRQLPGQRLGPARHARQHLRVVPGLVSPEAARRRRPRPARPRRRPEPDGTSRGRGGAAPGPTTAGPAGRPSGCGSSRSGGTTTSASASWRSGRRRARQGTGRLAAPSSANSCGNFLGVRSFRRTLKRLSHRSDFRALQARPLTDVVGTT